MYCEKCGTELRNGVKFCNKCGQSVNSNHLGEPQKLNESNNINTTANIPLNVKSTAGKAPKLMAVCAGVLVLVGFGVAWMILSGGESNQADSDSSVDLSFLPSNEREIAKEQEDETPPEDDEIKGSLLAKWIRYNEDGETSAWSEYEYDVNGNNTKTNCYYSNGSIDCWFEYEYDTNGNMTKEIVYNSDGSISGRWSEYEYDVNGNMTKEIAYDANSAVLLRNEYDVLGNIVKKINYNSDGSISSWSENEYDTNGNMTKESNYNSGSTLATWAEAEYDANGNMTK